MTVSGEVEDVSFAGRELFQWIAAGLVRGTFDVHIDRPIGQSPTQIATPSGYIAHGSDELVGRRVLQGVAFHAPAQGLQNVRLGSMDREDQHVRATLQSSELTRDVQPTRAWQSYIENYHVRVHLAHST